MHRADLYPLAQRLYTLIPEPLRRWTGEATDAAERDRLADALLDACHDTGLRWDVTNDLEASIQAVVISEALAGFLTSWGCRYGELGDAVDRAQAALVTTLGGTIIEPGHYRINLDLWYAGPPTKGGHRHGHVTVRRSADPPDRGARFDQSHGGRVSAVSLAL